MGEVKSEDQLTGETRPVPPKTDSQKDWERYLAKVGMPGELPKDRREIELSTMAEFGRRNRPPDYDPENDLYIGNTEELVHEDAVQCDGRIGVNGARKNPREFEKFLAEEERRRKRKLKRGGDKDDRL